eukprot:scaffold89419_cov52-Phaeocystis_antarctica.AAC.3
MWYLRSAEPAVEVSGEGVRGSAGGGDECGAEGGSEGGDSEARNTVGEVKEAARGGGGGEGGAYSSCSLAACLSASGICVKPPGTSSNCGRLCMLSADGWHSLYRQPSGPAREKGCGRRVWGRHGSTAAQSLLGHSCTQTARALLPGGWPASGGHAAARAAASEGTLTLLPHRPHELA